MKKLSVFLLSLIMALAVFTTTSCKKADPVVYTKDYFRVVYDSGERDIYKFYVLRPVDFMYETKEKDIVYSDAKIIFETDKNAYADSTDQDLLESTEGENEYINKWIGYNDLYGRYTVTETYTNGYTPIDVALEDLPEKDYYIYYKKGKIDCVIVWESAETQMHKTLTYDGDKIDALFYEYCDMKVGWTDDKLVLRESSKGRTDEGRLLDWVDVDQPWFEDDRFNWNDNQEVLDVFASIPVWKESNFSYLEHKSNYVDTDGWSRITYTRWIVPNSEDDLPKTATDNTRSNLREATLTDPLLKELYLETIKYWQYDALAYDYNYTMEQRLNSGRGICWDYALYFYNKCIENEIGNVHMVVSNSLKHAWNELWFNNKVYIIDPTFGDTDLNSNPSKYLLIPAARSSDHKAIDVIVVDDTLRVNDIGALYKGNVTDDAKRQQYTQNRPIIVYGSR